MSKKYEFVPGDEKIIAPGRTVKRIRALVAIPWLASAGDLGGYVESEKSLSQEGDAWISGNAHISGDAWISGNAHISGDAHISGNANISGDAHIFGDGLIFWASKVGSENGTLTVYNTKDNTLEVTRGCFRGTVDEFLTASESKHDDRTHLEYRLLVEVAYSRITHAQNLLK